MKCRLPGFINPHSAANINQPQKPVCRRAAFESTDNLESSFVDLAAFAHIVRLINSEHSKIFRRIVEFVYVLAFLCVYVFVC